MDRSWVPPVSGCGDFTIFDAKQKQLWEPSADLKRFNTGQPTFFVQKAVDSFPPVRYFNLDSAHDPRFIADRAEVSVLICLRAVVLFRL
jgi:hypothetical protein